MTQPHTSMQKTAEMWPLLLLPQRMLLLPVLLRTSSTDLGGTAALRVSRSHDQNRRRAGETADGAATLAVQRDARPQESGRILLTDTDTTENGAEEVRQEGPKAE